LEWKAGIASEKKDGDRKFTVAVAVYKKSFVKVWNFDKADEEL